MASNAHEARLPALTSLRFFAALYVLTFHSGASLMREHLGDNPLTTFLVNGHLGVSLFFILSGFMLTYSGERRNAQGFDLSAYALARFARIYPLYLLSLLIAAPIRWPDLLSSPLASLETLLMVQSWGPASSDRGWFWNMPAWTLSIEAFFYALFPVFLWLIARTRVTTAAAIAAVAGLLITVFALPDISRRDRRKAHFALGSCPLSRFRSCGCQNLLWAWRWPTLCGCDHIW